MQCEMNYAIGNQVGKSVHVSCVVFVSRGLSPIGISFVGSITDKFQLYRLYFVPLGLPRSFSGAWGCRFKISDKCFQHRFSI